MSQDEQRFEGQCFCGAVGVVVRGEAAGAGYCHCASCRSWSAGPVNAFTLWHADQVEVVRGAEHLGEYHKSDLSHRQWCTKCGGHVMTRHPAWGLVDVYAATIPSFPFQAGVHVNYEDTVLPMKDGLPKLEGFPPELGGSGRTLPEVPASSSPGATGARDLVAAARSEVPDITPASAAELIASGALVVDLREPAEIAASGKVKGAVAVPRGMLEFRADPDLAAYHEPAFQRDRPVILYCASGGRAALAGKALKAMGYAEVHNLGGFEGWAKAGGAVER